MTKKLSYRVSLEKESQNDSEIAMWSSLGMGAKAEAAIAQPHCWFCTLGTSSGFDTKPRAWFILGKHSTVEPILALGVLRQPLCSSATLNQIFLPWSPMLGFLPGECFIPSGLYYVNYSPVLFTYVV